MEYGLFWTVVAFLSPILANRAMSCPAPFLTKRQYFLFKLADYFSTTHELIPKADNLKKNYQNDSGRLFRSIRLFSKYVSLFWRSLVQIKNLKKMKKRTKFCPIFHSIAYSEVLNIQFHSKINGMWCLPSAHRFTTLFSNQIQRWNLCGKA